MIENVKNETLIIITLGLSASPNELCPVDVEQFLLQSIVTFLPHMNMNKNTICKMRKKSNEQCNLPSFDEVIKDRKSRHHVFC